LFGGVPSSERVERNESSIEIDLSSDQAMRPVVVDKESMSQEFHLTGLARASQVNDPAAGMRLKIELPRPWKGPAGRSLLDSSVQATAVGGDVSIGLELQSSQKTHNESAARPWPASGY
jgi:hypothetical protein